MGGSRREQITCHGGHARMSTGSDFRDRHHVVAYWRRLPTPPAPQRPQAVAAREIAIAAPGRLSLVKAVVVVAVVVVAGCDRILYAPGQDRS